MPRKLKVVLAHHERVIADTLVTILRLVNVDATAAYTGVSALELVFSTNPDVAFLCIVPADCCDLNGVYAAVATRALMPACRILLFQGGSGAWVDEPLALAKARGFEFELLYEPVHPDELVPLLKGMTGGEIEPIRSRSVPQAEEGGSAGAQPVDPLAHNPASAAQISRLPALRKYFKKWTGAE